MLFVNDTFVSKTVKTEQPLHGPPESNASGTFLKQLTKLFQEMLYWQKSLNTLSINSLRDFKLSSWIEILPLELKTAT